MRSDSPRRHVRSTIPWSRYKPTEPVCSRPPPKRRTVDGDVGLRTVLAASLAAATLSACGTESPGPATVPTTTSTSTAVVATVSGSVLLAATCPITVPSRPCPSQPVAAAVEVRDTLGGTARADGPLVAMAPAGDDGRYRVTVPPGTYVVSARTTTPATCSSVPITVERAPVTADLTCGSSGG